MDEDLDARIAQLQGLIGEDEAAIQQAQQLRSRLNVPGAPQGRGGGAPFGGEGKAPPRFLKDADDRSIFIQGLPRMDETPEELAMLFADCGPIQKCTLLRDRNTHTLKGIAYVEFASNEAAGRAIDTKQNVSFRNQFPLTVARKRSLFNPSRARGGRGRGGMDQAQAFMGAMMAAAMAAGAGARGGRGRGRGGGSYRGGRGFTPFQQ